MKILFVNSVFGSGSTGRIVADIASEAKARGYDCYVAYGLGAPSSVEGVSARRICNKTEYIVSNAFSKATGITGCFNFFSTRRLIKYIEKIKPDIVHLHNLHGYYVNFFRIMNYLKKNNIRTVWTLHDCWGFTGNCAYYSYVGCDKWTKECQNCPQLSCYPKSFAFDFTKFMYNKKKKTLSDFGGLVVTTPSNWLKQQVGRSFLKQYDCIAIYNGADTGIFSIAGNGSFAKKHGLEGKKIVLGVANAWGEKKGFFDFFKLASKLPDDFRIVLVGLDDKQMKTLPEGIVGITRTNNVSELVNIYNSAHVFVNPSYEETFGMVTMEALLCGTPVITYDKTAVPEIVTEKCGYVVKAGDVDAVADKILHMGSFDKNELRKEALVYRKENMVDLYLKVYDEILKR